MAFDQDQRAGLLAAIDAGRAISEGATLSSVRLPDPSDPAAGIVVHLFNAERAELTAALRAILLRRVEIAAAPRVSG